MYEYAVEARDPEGDPAAFELETEYWLGVRPRGLESPSITERLWPTRGARN